MFQIDRGPQEKRATGTNHSFVCIINATRCVRKNFSSIDGYPRSTDEYPKATESIRRLPITDTCAAARTLSGYLTSSGFMLISLNHDPVARFTVSRRTQRNHHTLAAGTEGGKSAQFKLEFGHMKRKFSGFFTAL